LTHTLISTGRNIRRIFMPGESGKIRPELGMGWLPEYPDYRDLSIDAPEVPSAPKSLGQKDSVKDMLAKAKVEEPEKASIPETKSLRQWCSPVENQGSLGSCTANAGVALMEYYERRAFGRHIDASRLFLYKATRNLMDRQGDTGAFIRTTMAAMVLFGVPPEKYWPYVIADFDREPSSFCYAFAQNYQALQYFRLDPPNISREALLKRIKVLIAAGLPSMFGFTVFSSISQAEDDGKIPYPCRGEGILGGHAVLAVGYNDKLSIKNAICGAETIGAFLIRNSWGAGWGENGYGWLPYEYVLKGMAIDWWTLLRNEWVNTGEFGL
jgi:C1A family cysteine protease